MLSAEDKRRYSRNTLLPEIGPAGQERLLASTVAVVGCGALGSMCAMYLAGSGVGHLRVADFDTIDISNLQRQLSFTTAQCGLKKAECLRARLLEINPGIDVQAHDLLLRRSGAASLFEGCDLVVEGSDNPDTKYLVSDLCAEMKIPYVLGGVSSWQGQVMSWAPHTPPYPTYRDLYPEQAPAGGYTPCSLGGLPGPLPGIIGSMQALEAVKILTGAGRPLFGRLFIFDALTSDALTVAL